MSRFAALNPGHSSSEEDVELESAEDSLHQRQGRVGIIRALTSGLSILVLGTLLVSAINNQFSLRGAPVDLVKLERAGRMPGVIQEQALAPQAQVQIPREWNVKVDNILRHWPRPRPEIIVALQKYNGDELQALNYIEEQHLGCGDCALTPGTTIPPLPPILGTTLPNAPATTIIGTTAPQIVTQPPPTTLPPTEQACDFNKPPPDDPTIPAMCTVPDLASDKSYQEACAGMEKWAAEAKRAKAGGNCAIDPNTHVMVCENHAQCKGGAQISRSVTFVNRSLRYNCPAHCEGALLIDCCHTCLAAQANPAEFRVTSILCPGCDRQSQQLASDTTNGACTWSGNEFECKTSGHCELGTAEEHCSASNWECNVVPCNKCTDDQLKAKCCADCLGRACGGKFGRMYCAGCDKAPLHGFMDHAQNVVGQIHSGLGGIDLSNPFR